MSVYTAGEIVVWLVLAAGLGVVLGWLLASRHSGDPADGGRGGTRTGLRREATSGSSGPIPPATGAPAPRAGALRRHERPGGSSPAGAFRGSALPGPGGGSPGPEYEVKANVDSMTYHLPGTPTHARVTADVWFKDADAARSAGFRPPP